MLERLKRIALWLVPLVVLVIGWQFSFTAYLIGWCACIYVLWRAFPAIRNDWRTLYARFFPDNIWRF